MPEEKESANYPTNLRNFWLTPSPFSSLNDPLPLPPLLAPSQFCFWWFSLWHKCWMVPKMNLQFQIEYLKEHLMFLHKCSSDFGEKTTCPSNTLSHSMFFGLWVFTRLTKTQVKQSNYKQNPRANTALWNTQRNWLHNVVYNTYCWCWFTYHRQNKGGFNGWFGVFGKYEP